MDNSRGVFPPPVADAAVHMREGKVVAAAKLAREKAEEAAKARAARAGKSTVSYTRAEVALHGTPEDAWIVIEDRIYDITEFVANHPGGDIILTHAGADATDIFAAFHSEGARDLFGNYFVGDLEDPLTPPVIAEIRKLREEFAKEGLFEASGAYYTFKVVFNTGMAALSWWMVLNTESTPALLVSAMIMGLFWQQCGWLSHDFLHHQVFDNREWGNFFGYFLGNFYQGFSTAWWKNKHNTHHAVPNILHGDPDIDTLPFLAWGEAMVEGELEGLPDFLIRNQQTLYWPLLAGARLNWALQSIVYVLTAPDSRIAQRGWEKALLAAHWVFVFAIMYGTGSFTRALIWFMAAQVTCGVCLGGVFSLNHNAMEILPEDSVNNSNFAEIQARSTRNINPSRFNDWFTGGLDYQLEHHLFPQIPRHNFHLIRPRVMAMYKKHGIPYHTESFWDATKMIVASLGRIANNYSTSVKNSKTK